MLNLMSWRALWGFLHKRRAPSRPHQLISILKPLKGLDPSLEENLRSYFALDPRRVELLFSVENQKDPAFDLIIRLLKEYPSARAKLLISEGTQLGPNPKINNLASAYQAASSEMIMISDSNTRASQSLIEDIMDQLHQPQTGVVTALIVGTHPKSWGAWLEAVHLNTYSLKMMALSNRYARPFVVGKAMAFRKRQIERFGGLSALSAFLAEDYMAGEAVRRLGLQVRTAAVPIEQPIGRIPVRAFWNRHLRWGRIRKSHVPLAYAFEPITYPVFWVFITALWGHWLAAFGLLTTLGMLDGLLFWAATKPFTLRPTRLKDGFSFAFAWLFKELIAIPLWICIGAQDQIEWRGNPYKILPGGKLQC